MENIESSVRVYIMDDNMEEIVKHLNFYSPTDNLVIAMGIRDRKGRVPNGFDVYIIPPSKMAYFELWKIKNKNPKSFLVSTQLDLEPPYNTLYDKIILSESGYQLLLEDILKRKK